MSWRWKMTLLGIGIGVLSGGLWTTPGAIVALSRGYTTPSIVYVVASVSPVTVFGGIWHILGTKEERQLNGEE